MMNLSEMLPLKVQLLGIVELDYKLICETGLLIRSSTVKEVIGGYDDQPMSTKKLYKFENGQEYLIEVPFIPGSSLKGKIRSSLEHLLGLDLYSKDGKIFQHYRDIIKDKSKNIEKLTCTDINCPVDTIFGSPAIHIGKLKDIANLDDTKKKELIENLAPTRVIIVDAFPSIDYVKKLLDEKRTAGLEIVEFYDFLEEKAENRLDRITCAADPRTFLRVKPGVEFEGKILYLVYEKDLPSRFNNHYKILITGLKHVEDTYLGSSGTRGYGRVKFKDIRIRVKPRSFYIGSGKLKDIESFDTLDELLSKIDDVVSNISKILGEELEVKG